MTAVLMILWVERSVDSCDVKFYRRLGLPGYFGQLLPDIRDLERVLQGILLPDDTRNGFVARKGGRENKVHDGIRKSPRS